MNFKEQFEHRYNAYWNNVIVSAYREVKACRQSPSSVFFANEATPVNGVIKYCDGVLTLITNLSRQLPFFDDQEYALNYLQQTKDAAVADLNKFQTYVTNSFALNKIKQTMVVLDSLAQKEQVRTEMDTTLVASGVITDIEMMSESSFSFEPLKDEWESMMRQFDQTYTLENVFAYPNARHEVHDQEMLVEIGRFVNS
ncbi:hypothetical protein [Legionella clemsonensis]|uniref:Uncharacterized protein n=1 Tax=Legionella clemsonensis TaxID=1867846 RepID=A0A222P4B7_9GAMM|nr:hypothetical protein [Legionella clemsonensis]ASQ46663.1 hypothetical protein clem_10585 [Legionella clemsonensis]